jgi:predicted  nucleic acid-binding Zn-ribbon protein
MPDCKKCGIPDQPVKHMRMQDRRIKDLLEELSNLKTANRSLKAELASARKQLDRSAQHIMDQRTEVLQLRRRLPSHT